MSVPRPRSAPLPRSSVPPARSPQSPASAPHDGEPGQAAASSIVSSPLASPSPSSVPSNGDQNAPSLQALNATLQALQTSITQLQNTVNQQTATINQQNESITQLANITHQQNTTIIQQNVRITQLEATLHQRDQTIIKQNQTIIEQNERINRLERNIAQKKLRTATKIEIVGGLLVVGGVVKEVIAGVTTAGKIVAITSNWMIIAGVIFVLGAEVYCWLFHNQSAFFIGLVSKMWDKLKGFFRGRRGNPPEINQVSAEGQAQNIPPLNNIHQQFAPLLQVPAL